MIELAITLLQFICKGEKRPEWSFVFSGRM